MIYIILLIIGLPLLVLIVSTIKNGKFGINLSLPNCPKCGQNVPAVRKPSSINQALWGGWTCSNCECEMDKWGKAIVAEDEKIPHQIEPANQTPFITFEEQGKTPLERVFDEK